MRRRGLLLMIVGIIVAGVAGLLVFFASTSAQPAPAPVAVVPTATPLAVQELLLAARDIPARGLVSASDVVTREYPLGLAPADAIQDAGEVLSHTAATQIFAGEILVKRQFSPLEGDSGVSAILPAGKVLVAFPATDMLNATGAVQAGDHVDILISLSISGTTTLNPNTPAQEGSGSKALVTQATMQNVTVYSTGVWSPTGSGGDSSGGLKVITFIVDRQEALILKYIKDSGGTIDLIVRSAADGSPGTTDPVSLDYLVELYHLVNVPSR
jgi:pilus assembly protein CpaB